MQSRRGRLASGESVALSLGSYALLCWGCRVTIRTGPCPVAENSPKDVVALRLVLGC